MPRAASQSALLVLTMLPKREAAESLARELLASRLAACIQIGATVHSLYHWRGEIETAEETPVAIKTRAALYPQLEAAIRARALSPKRSRSSGVGPTKTRPAVAQARAKSARSARKP